MAIDNIQSKHLKLEPVWFIHVELAARDDARVRETVTKAVGLFYGSYDRVASPNKERALSQQILRRKCFSQLCFRHQFLCQHHLFDSAP
jgi:hypothetical protein